MQGIGFPLENLVSYKVSYFIFNVIPRDQARGRFGQNSHPRGGIFALNWAQGEVGVFLEFLSNHSTKQAVMAI